MNSNILNLTEVLATHYFAGQLQTDIQSELINWQHQNKVQRLWSSDPTLWTNSDENHWTGWLDLVNHRGHIPRIIELTRELQKLNASDIVVLGMGGSSLCPAMFAQIFGKIDHFPRLHVLDSTDPTQIEYLQKHINLKQTYFIVSSKSGTTLEPNIFKDYFYNQLQKALDKREVGERFIAITDPYTQLDKLARTEYFRAVFYGVPSVGGRYSALSNFGMVPLGLMGANVEHFLIYTGMIQKMCLPSVPAEHNPAVILGVTLGMCAKHGKNKVTFIVSPAIYSLGAWLEQLIAESTGKEGKGLIPIDQEPLGDPSVYGHDRVFAYIRLESNPDPEQDEAIDRLEKAGFVVIRTHVVDKMHLGCELFRWEMATAVAGSIIGINPFNQPDVEASKKLALQFTEEYEKTGQFETPAPFYSDQGLELFASSKIQKDLQQKLSSTANLSDYLRAFLKLADKNDYINFSAFIAMLEENQFQLQKSRVLLRNKTQLATCMGFGPRFLHSTGQDYKGGPNTGLFFQITANHKHDIPVPDHNYTFGFVINAQAQADFTVLGQRDRRVLRIHLGDDVDKGLHLLYDVFQRALGESN